MLHMSKLITHRITQTLATILVLVMSIGSVLAQVPTEQDCLGAIPICDETYTVSSNHNGMGNYPNEIFNVGGCYAPEQRSIWLQFTIQTAGLLRFSIDPLNANQDHDWTLFDMTNTTCAALGTNAGAAAAMVRSNTWGAFGFNGSTGVSTPNGGVGNCNGPGGFNGPKWCADLNVAVGETYYLHITNWTGTVYGFTVDFSSSTAVLFDNIPPAMDSITSPVNCAAFDSIRVQFDEELVCSSIQAGDFVLEGPGGLHTVTSADGVGCGTYTDQASIEFTPPVTQIGQYYLKIQSGAGYVEDLCGNLDTLDSIGFFFDGVVAAQLIPDHLDCFEVCDGSIDVDITSGAAPYSYAWSGGLPPDSNQVGLCAGNYTVTITDDVGCTLVVDTTLDQAPDITTSTLNVEGISCHNTVACDGSASASSTGGTPPYFYTWSSSESGFLANQLCADTNFIYTTDGNGCMDTLPVVIPTPLPVLTTGFGDTMICISNIASIAGSATGGNSPYNYNWKEGSPENAVTYTNQVIQVSPDTTTSFFVQSIDNNGCLGDTAEVVVKVRPPLGVSYEQPDTICPYDTIPLEVEGQGGDSIYTYAWETGQFGSSISVSPDAPRWYRITVSDACGTPVHRDSIYVQVGGYSAITSSVTLEDDSICRGASVYLIARGSGGFNGPTEYTFDWSHTNDDNPVQFVHPTKTTTYQLSIGDLCLSEPGQSSVTIYVGEPETPSVVSSVDEACGASLVEFTKTNYNPKSTYHWIIGDARYERYPVDSIIQTFDDPGCVPVELEVVTPFGCKSKDFYPCLVEILDTPDADFQYAPILPSNTQPYTVFENTSLGADQWFWIINRDTFQQSLKLPYVFDVLDSFATVELHVQNAEGCADSIEQLVRLIFETTLYYPSGFTPNNDGLNDVFKIEGESIAHQDYDLVIYDRWGTQVFRSNNPDRGWDGHWVNGPKVIAGSYPFVLRYRDHYGELHVVRDQVMVVNTGEQTGLR
jgi:gliding motility-associated-like protein